MGHSLGTKRVQQPFYRMLTVGNPPVATMAVFQVMRAKLPTGLA